MSYSFVVVVTIACAAAVSAPIMGQTIPERVAAEPSEPLVIGSLVDVRPLSLEALARRADIIVEARVSRQRSYLSPDEKAVFSDFLVVPERAIGGRVPFRATIPGSSAPIVLTVYGGETVVSGVSVRAVSHNMRPIRDGGRYLLFLVPFDAESGRYQLLNQGAFEIEDDKIQPIRKEYATVFPDLVGARYSQLRPDIERAAKERR